MKQNDSSSKNFLSSIVGDGAHFSGNLEMAGLLRLDGDFNGIIKNNDRILIGKNGRVQGTAYSDTIIVGGVFKGEIYASEKVVILSSGIVLGHIYSSRIVIEEGAYWDGKSIISLRENEIKKDSILRGSFKLDWNKVGQAAPAYTGGFR
ncbi:MAG: polymer-forming cytoskeletal protein [Spirochaetales bacterium]|nr:polymer-forming cytoskeletal protein [Spirochaetales bacterium]